MNVTSILSILDNLFPNPPIPLSHVDPFTLLIATLLSARCQDTRVNQVTADLFLIAPTPQELLSISLETLERLIAPCGLHHTKARALKSIAQILVEKFAGTVPQNFQDLESLPGVGHKTASVVMVQAFNIPAFPVDTHIHRLAKRWGLSKGSHVAQTESDLKAIFPENQWKKIHLQMIWYGRTYCTAKKHVIKECPICLLCQDFGP